MIYGTRSNGNSHGLVLTKPQVVEFMLDRVGFTAKMNLRDIKVIEPAAGDGAFAIEIIDRLYLSSLEFDFPFQQAISNLTFFEIDVEMADLLKERVRYKLNYYSASIPEGLIRIEDFLLSKTNKCDLVIGNPPYVRHENIPEVLKKEYRNIFGTFTHRSDLYIAFYEKGLKLLKNEGILTFICSNRWLKNQYGKGLRKLIHLTYSLKEIIDLEETCPFEENVIAYPAITTIIKSSHSAKASYYKINNLSNLVGFDFEAVSLRTICTSNSLNWFPLNSKGYQYEKFLDSIENQGFEIGIGVATGSDKVFIRNDFKTFVEHDLLIPILTSRDLKNNQLNWSGNYILNPFNKDGGLIDLNRFPKAKNYLESKREILDKRHISKKNPKFWYKTIDRINQNLTNEYKIVLPDISGNSHLFIDKGNFYPHHNIYYIKGNGYDKLAILAALLMSDFVLNQLLELGTKMNGGYPRWQSQNLKKLRIPLINAIPVESAAALLNAYHSRDYKIINELIAEDNLSKYDIFSGQTKLFEPEPQYQNKSNQGQQHIRDNSG